MEILAENRFIITKSLFYEGTLRVSKEGYGKTARKIVLVLAALWAVIVAVTLLTRGNPMFILIELVILGLVAVWVAVYVPRNNAKRAFGALQNKYGAELERVTTFYADHLEVEGYGVSSRIEYADIRQVLYSKNLLVLVTQDKVGVMLKLDGFTLGDAERVRKLIKDQALT